MELNLNVFGCNFAHLKNDPFFRSLVMNLEEIRYELNCLTMVYKKCSQKPIVHENKD